MEADTIETCPYDRAHRIRRSRMQFHLTICSKNHKQAKMKRCHYNARHVIKEDEYEKHLLECPSRELVMAPVSSDDTENAPMILPVDSNLQVDGDGWGGGEWGNDANFQTYKPLEVIQNRPIVHAKIGLSKAQRKKHRLQERQRYNEVMQNNAAQPPTTQMCGD